MRSPVGAGQSGASGWVRARPMREAPPVTSACRRASPIATDCSKPVRTAGRAAWGLPLDTRSKARPTLLHEAGAARALAAARDRRGGGVGLAEPAHRYGRAVGPGADRPPRESGGPPRRAGAGPRAEETLPPDAAARPSP